MFAVIYRGFVKTGRDAEYRELWHKIATFFIEHRGAIGSSLHQADDGMMVAYSRWPDRHVRNASWPQENTLSDDFPHDIQKAIHALRDCLIEENKPSEICMEVVEDLL